MSALMKMPRPFRSISSFLVTTVLATALLAGRPVHARAQLTAADSAAVLLETARTFEARERPDVAEALYRLVLERYGSTEAAATARARLAAVSAAASSGSGAVELQVWMTLYGAWLGVAVPAAFGSDAAEAYGVGLLAGGPTGFIAGRALARALDLSEGQARAITLGGTWGTWQGLGWQEVFEIGIDQTCGPDPFGGSEDCYANEDTSEEMFAAMIVGGLAGIGTGALLAGRDISPGTGTVVNFGSLWGTWFGVAGGTIAGLDGDDLLAASLVGGDVALLATALLAPGWNVTRSRARMVSIAGVLGGLAGAGIDLIAQPDDTKVAMGIPLAGSLLGLTLGVLATRDDLGTREASAGSAPADGALLSLDDGRLALGTPVPLPSMRPVDGPRGTSWAPVVAFDLFRASF